MIRRRESTIKSRILEEEDDEENSRGPQDFYDIHKIFMISNIDVRLWTSSIRTDHYQGKTFIPYSFQTYSNRKVSRQFSNRQIGRLEEHTAIMHFFFALSLSFLIW